MNRFSAFILAAAVAPGVFAQDFDSGGLNFSVLSGDAGTCIVTGANTEIEGVLDIPAVVTYDGVDYTVTEIGEWAFSYKGLYGINFPSTLEVIRSCAFFNFYGLSDLVFPDSLKEIQYQAFYACSELRNVNLGTGVMTIGESAFGETNLGIVKSGNEVPPVLETSFDDIFPHVGAVAVPSSLVAAYSQAWAGANVVPDIAATSLSIEPSSVKVMPGDSFKINAIVEPADAPVFFLNNNRDVLNVDKDGNVSTDPYSANYWGSVTVSTLNGLEESCQIEVADFNSFSVDGVRYALMNGSDTEVMISGIENELPSVWTVPASVEHDGKAYSVVAMTQNIAGWRQELEEVVIPSTMRYIGNYNFYGCENLKSVTIEDGMEPLEIAANGEVFASSGVTRFYLGRNLTGAAPMYFEYLERLPLGENVTSLPEGAFHDTSRLALVESLNPEPPVLGEGALGWNTWNITVVVPAGSEDAYRTAWGDRFSNITSPVEATSITLAQSALTLYTGQEPQLELTVEPAGATVIWTSSDSNIVGVSPDGRLSYWSDSEGVVTITASTLNGLSAECEVTASRWFHFPEESVTIEPGSIKQLSVTDMAPAIADSSVTWRTEWGEDVAAVNESGLLRGLTYGDSYMYAEVEVPDMGPRGYGLPVYVRDFPQSVELADTVVNVFLNNGGRKDIEVRFEPEGENVSHNMVWTVDNPEVAEIRMENYGEIRYCVEAKSLGDTKFKGVSPNGLTVGGLIRVMNEIQDMEVSPSTVYIEPGDTCTLKWTTTPVETNQQVVWESVNPEIATVDENGVVTGVAYGRTSLVARLLTDWGNTDRSVDVNVCRLPESVTLVNDSIVFTSLWNAQNLDLAFTPDEEEVCKDIVWTVENPDVAWVGYNSDFNEEGQEVSRTYYIASRDFGRTAFSGVTPNGLKVEGMCVVDGLKIDDVNPYVTVGDEIQLEFTASSEEIAKAARWECYYPAEKISVNEDGLVTTRQSGDYSISLTSFVDDRYYYANTNIYVRPEAGTIALGETSIRMMEGSWSDRLRVYFPNDEWYEGEWTVSDPEVLEITGNYGDGIDFRALKAGSAIISFETTTGLVATCDVTVMGFAESISFSKENVVLPIGESVSLEATILPAGTNQTPSYYSSDPGVATVDENGNVEAVGYGDALISADAYSGTYDRISAQCLVQVRDLPESVEMTRDSLMVEEGRFIELYVPEFVRLAPESDWLASNLAWTSSDPEVMSCEVSGDYIYVYGLQAGNAVLGATTVNGLEAEMEVKVYKAASGITLDKDSALIEPGESIELKAVVSPENTNQTIVWRSSDEKVAAVDANGVVVAVAYGDAEIAAVVLGSNGVELSASCAVSVRALPQSIAFASDNLDMETGDVETFEVKSFVVVEPAGEWLLDSLTWNTSDAGVAIVDVADDTVKVIAVGVGECVISATTVNGLTAELPVSVSDPFVYISSISVDPTVVTAVEGEEVQLVVEILPEDATDKTLEWESSDENVATVDASGLVKVISQGEAVITVRTTDGSNLSAECRVSIVTGIDAIFAGEGDADIYTANGLLLKRNVSRGEFMQFEPGIYILRNATRSVKVMR